jgi:hypothetical protein
VLACKLMPAVTLLVILYQEQAGQVQPDLASGDNSTRAVAFVAPAVIQNSYEQYQSAPDGHAAL